MSNVYLEDLKKVTTYGAAHKENGWLLELFKSKDGVKTEVYISTTLPQAFKGYHLHRVRAARYVCLKGIMKITTYELENGKWVSSEHILDAQKNQRLFIPNNVATGLENIGNEEGWLVNYPDPAYDPNLLDEQVEYTKEELEKGIVK